MNLSIIIPAYNEENQITKTIDDLKLHYSSAELIVVDDCSSDNTFQILSDREVNVIRHRCKRGYGAALKTGIRSAKNENICLFDADGQHNAKDIKRLLEHIDINDMVVGARERGSYVDPERIPGKKILNFVANFLMKQKIPDINSGLRIIKRTIIKKYIHLLPDGFSASTTLTLIMLSRGYEVKWIPIKVTKRIGKSSVSQLRDGVNVFLLIIRIMSLFNPLRVFLPISIFSTLIGIIYGTYKLFTVGTIFPVGGFIFIFIGVMSFFFGITVDQISELRKERFEVEK
ncbi:MAG: glycosyltransferase family 2 protein [Candidatus Omnitrophica bacterium]|nr:glycosyltransferase family 2 protein [Candidatus Omnitrophota bacterium]